MDPRSAVPTGRASADPALALVEQSAAALAALLAGFERAAERNERALVGPDGARDVAELYQGLLATLLRLAFLALAEARGLLGATSPAARGCPSMVQLVLALQQQARRAPATLAGRFGVWARLCARQREVFHGATAPTSARQAGLGVLLDPSRFPFLDGAARATDGLAAEVDHRAPTPALCLDDAAVLEVLDKLLCVGGAPVAREKLDDEQLGRTYEALLGFRIVRAKGGLVLGPVGARRHTGSHFTPRALSAPIVRRTLEPLLACMAPSPRSEQLLGLRICDPALGGGAFLLESCRALGDALVEAWTRERSLARIRGTHGDVVRHARRLVAQRCLFGVDRDELAVEVAKLSLWLVVGDDEQPFTFLDHALRHGDSLLGLTLEQIRSFHWKPEPRRSMAHELHSNALQGPKGAARARLIGDLIVGAFLGAAGDAARERERRRRLDLVRRWLAGDRAAEAELGVLQAEIRACFPVFHWPVEFPEVFRVERRDPLDADGARGVRSMDAFVGNPPFLGGKRISTEHGAAYADWLCVLHGSSKNADLAAHFFRRADHLLGERGVIGFIATNTLSEGDTRRDGLRYLIAEAGHVIYEAVKSMPWPGQAAVHIAVVHTAKGAPAGRDELARRLDGRPVAAIDSMLRPVRERGEARVLPESQGVCFIGCFLRGRGFVLGPDEARRLGATREPPPGAPLRPFLGGEEVNHSPTHDFGRFVIDFGDWPLERAAAFPALLGLLEERVRPARSALGHHAVDRGHMRRWWQFANPRPELRAAIASLARCLVAARVTKHLCYSFQPTCRTFSDQLCVFALDGYAHFATLQSRLHEQWARVHSSTLGEGLRYAPSDCVETFPFPRPNPRAVVPALETIGERLYRTRAAHMVGCNEGLTTTYNRLKDPACRAEPILALRRLHEELDRVVLDAYGWRDVEVPPFCPASARGVQAVEAFSQTVIDRLYRLNAERARAAQPG